MTAINVTAFGAPSTHEHSTRLRLTVRGRRVLALLAALPAVVSLVVAIVSGGGALASREGSAPLGTFDQLTVAPGDTLWSIAESVAPGADPRDVVDAIVRLNALDSGLLEAGQMISIPLEYSAGE
ncbi:LysM peptidoglycan-binding domain-containing protein [Microbacterium sp.]|uniref:LysM peptidoglycan-binding domain-containing protein n=1 Tax=Microbacterium sp. TaxID=51671 RepID=UPI0025FD417A|nr:LysM peptidoglycan-binding domain-containing protein [Microbacterium sp.]